MGRDRGVVGMGRILSAVGWDRYKGWLYENACNVYNSLEVGQSARS